MQFRAVLNRDGGTFSTMDLAAFSIHLEEKLRRAGHGVTLRIVAGGELADAIREAAAQDGVDVLLAGGGDGTVSLAAGLLADGDKILGILPAGTMNLFARSLGIPLDVDAAVDALAYGRVRQVDIGRVNGRPFVHQFSVGMHPQLIHLRSRIPFQGRLGKIVASARAAVAALLRPHNLRAAISMGETEVVATASGISVTNNLYGEGHLPFADKPDGGVLGVYITRARRPLDLLFHFLNMALGRWRRNDQVEIHEAGEVRLRILAPRRHLKYAVDGELCPMEPEIHIRLHPKSLRVLVPSNSSQEAAGEPAEPSDVAGDAHAAATATIKPVDPSGTSR